MKFHAKLLLIVLLAIQASLATLLSSGKEEESVLKQIPKISIVHKRIPCQLEWTKNSNGVNINNNYVTLSSKRIGRVKILGQYTFGLISHSQNDPSSSRTIPTGSFYSSKEKRTLQLTNFETLSNPNNCHLIWEPMGLEDGGWNCNTPYCIGRRRRTGIASDVDSSFEICTPSEDSKKCFPSSKNNNQKSMDFEILRSIQQNLDYRLDDMQLMENEIMDIVNFRGTDRILNAANVEVETSINQGSGKSQENGDEKRTLTSTGNGSKQEISANYSSNSFSESIGAARGLRIPPFTFIEACSTISLPDLNLPIKMLVSFYAPGLSSGEVEEILKATAEMEGPFAHSDNFTAVQVELERVIEKGMLLADLSVETKFYTKPVNIRGDDTCGLIRKNLGNVRQQKVLELRQKLIKK